MLELETLRKEHEKDSYVKRIALFLVPTVALVFQQRNYLQCQLSGKVKGLCGSSMPDDVRMSI
jgi:hypothetical protein